MSFFSTETSSSPDTVEESIVVSPLFQGLSKPATLWSVDYNYVLSSGVLVLLLFIGSGSLLALLFFLPFHLLGLILGAMDPHIFKLIAVRAVCGRVPNYRYWGCQSYEAY